MLQIVKLRQYEKDVGGAEKKSQSAFPRPPVRMSRAFSMLRLMAQQCRQQFKISKLVQPTAIPILTHSKHTKPTSTRKFISQKKTFHDKTVIRYENRLRRFASPDKVFRYFATLKVLNQKGHYEICMTPKDFVRSFLPGTHQPDMYGLDKYKIVKSASNVICNYLPANSIFYKINPQLFIKFPDYVFLLNLLFIPERVFEIGFRMFDVKDDGELDADEFDLITNLYNSAYNNVHLESGFLKEYLFGKKLNRTLSLTKYMKFHEQLHKEILMVAYALLRKKNKDRISELAFANSVTSNAVMPERNKEIKLNRIKKKYAASVKGITFKEYMDFFTFLKHISLVKTALSFFFIAGAPVAHQTIKHVAKIACGVELSDHTIDILITLLDDNGDGQLSRSELMPVMRDRIDRGVVNRGLIFSQAIKAYLHCAGHYIPHTTTHDHSFCM